MISIRNVILCVLIKIGMSIESYHLKISCSFNDLYPREIQGEWENLIIGKPFETEKEVNRWRGKITEDKGILSVYLKYDEYHLVQVADYINDHGSYAFKWVETFAVTLFYQKSNYIKCEGSTDDVIGSNYIPYSKETDHRYTIELTKHNE